MVKIRLTRMGNRKRPFYRVVVAEDSHRRDGRFIEILGTYDPLQMPAAIEVKADSVLKWLSRGAQPTDTVKEILRKSGVWAHWRAVQAGQAELGEMTGQVSGTLERSRPGKPSRKAAGRIVEEEEKGGVEVAPEPVAEVPAEEPVAEVPAEEVPAEETPAEEAPSAEAEDSSTGSDSAPGPPEPSDDEAKTADEPKP